MKSDEIEGLLNSLRYAIENMGISEMAKFIKSKQSDLVKALNEANRRLGDNGHTDHTDSLNNSIAYKQGYDDALSLMEKEGKVVVVNHFVTPFG